MIVAARKFVAARMSMNARARLVARVFPERHWVRIARRLSCLQARLTARSAGRNWRPSAAFLLDHWLIELTRLGPFPIAMRVVGEELLTSQHGDSAGIVVTGAHVPYCGLVPRAALMTGKKIGMMVVVEDNMTPDGTAYLASGLAHHIPATRPGAAAFLRARRILRTPGSIMLCQLDAIAGGQLSPSLLRLAGRLGARVVLYRTLFDQDGAAEVTFYPAPHPYCKTDLEIEHNVHFIAAEAQKLLLRHDL